MKNIKNSQQAIIQQAIVPSILAAVPVTITYLAGCFLGNKKFSWTDIIITIIAYFISAVCIFLINKHIIKKRYRTYKEYEGRWIEIIPDFPRKISVCNLYFDDEGYHFDGNNYCDDNETPVSFYSYKFIEDKNNSFFYITDNTQTHRRQGYGKIENISKENKGFYTASGYFFEYPAEDEYNAHETEMVKFDRDFFDKNKKDLNLSYGDNPENFNDIEIYECVKPYVIKRLHNKYGVEVH